MERVGYGAWVGLIEKTKPQPQEANELLQVRAPRAVPLCSSLGLGNLDNKVIVRISTSMRSSEMLHFFSLVHIVAW